MTRCQITCKSLQKSFKCQNFLRVWHLVFFRGDQSKKLPCISTILRKWMFKWAHLSSLIGNSFSLASSSMCSIISMNLRHNDIFAHKNHLGHTNIHWTHAKLIYNRNQEHKLSLFWFLVSFLVEHHSNVVVFGNNLKWFNQLEKENLTDNYRI